MAKTRKYYTLAVRENGGQWGPQFGDYHREVVAQELRDTRQDWPRGTEFTILSTGPRARDINEAIAALNQKVSTEPLAKALADLRTSILEARS